MVQHPHARLVCRRGMGATGMTGTNEPNAEVWQQLFASLIGVATSDAAIIREFCAQHAVTPAEVMREMLAHRRTPHQQGPDKPNAP
jgi:hypothetical protein